MRNNSSQYGQNNAFTLIEVLVVIAIIGILAAMILAGLNVARQKARDARIKSDVSQIRDNAASYYDDQSPASYDGFSPATTSPDNATISDDVDKQTNISGSLKINTNTDNGSDAYAAWSILASNDAMWFCADSSGKAGLTPTDPATVNDASNAKCPDDMQ